MRTLFCVSWATRLRYLRSNQSVNRRRNRIQAISSDGRSKMAARSDAAAAPGPKDGAFMSFNVVCSSPNSVNLPLTHKEITPKHIYDRRSLLDIATRTNTNLRRRLLRSYEAFVYCWSRTSRPRPRLLMLPAQGSVTSGVREDGSAVSAEVYERG